jgi:hypothetical protein
MTTDWKIANVKSKSDNGLVIEVTYIMNFKLEDKEDRHVGMVTLEGDPESPNFVPYEELTQEIVLGWIQNELGQTKIDEITSSMQTRLQERIDREKNPPFKTGLPWMKTSGQMDESQENN